MITPESNLVLVTAETGSVSTTDYISQARSFINASLDLDVAEHVDESFHEFFRSTLLDHEGASRGRPIMTLIAGEALGLPWKLTKGLALGVEKFHNYSLIEDDMPSQDNSQTRRGKPSAWKEFGEGEASLGSTFMLAEAFRSIAVSDRQSYLSGRLSVEHVQPLIKRLLVGQQQDLSTFKGGDKAPVTVKRLDKISLGKTAPLFEMGIVGAAIIASAPAAVRDGLTEYAQQAGIVLQINNDLEDPSGRGDDARNGKPTYTSLLGGIEPAKQKLRQHAVLARAAIEPLVPGIDILHLTQAIRYMGRQVYLAAEAEDK